MLSAFDLGARNLLLSRGRALNGVVIGCGVFHSAFERPPEFIRHDIENCISESAVDGDPNRFVLDGYLCLIVDDHAVL